MDHAPLTLAAVLFPQFEVLDLYGPLEMFGNLPRHVRVVTVAARPGPVASDQGPATVAEAGFAERPAPDLVLVPGGRGTFPAAQDAALLDWLRGASAGARRVMSVCTGSGLLAAAGLLDGRRATTNKQFFSLVAEQGPDVDWVRSARWVTDGPFVTSSGVSAGTDMALAVIADLFGEDLARLLAEHTEFQRHRDADDDPFAAFLDQGTTLPR